MDIESIRRYAESGFWVDSSEEDLERIRFLLSEVDRLSVESALRQRDADTARAEVEKLRAENRDLDNLQSELHDAYQKVSDWNKELLSLVAECRPVVEAVRKAQANSCCDKACAHCGEMLRMKLPAMEGGE